MMAALRPRGKNIMIDFHKKVLPMGLQPQIPIVR